MKAKESFNAIAEDLDNVVDRLRHIPVKVSSCGERDEDRRTDRQKDRQTQTYSRKGEFIWREIHTDYRMLK